MHFGGCSSLKYVTILEGLEHIEANAFMNCSNLTSITLPDTLKTIGANAFYKCTSLIAVTIPSSVTAMGNKVFLECSSLSIVDFNASVNSIPANTFYNCTSLITITFPDDSPISIIDNEAFGYCSSLSYITLPKHLNTIKRFSFEYCTSLSIIYFPKTIISIDISVGNSFFQCSTSKLMMFGYPNTIAETCAKKYKYQFFPLPLIDSITLSGSSTVNVESEIALSATISPTDAYNTELLWRSSNPEVAEVEYNTGIVTAIKAGKTTISAHSLDASAQEAYIEITVTANVTSLAISGPNSVNVGSKVSLNTDIKPLSAENKNLSWSSSNEKIATVDQNGIVTGVKSGKVIISASSTDGTNITKSHEITVVNKISSISILGLNSVDVGEKINLKATITPDNADNKTISWSSSNNKIATVDQNGIVSTKRVGTVNITASATDGSGVKGTYKITVRRAIPFTDVYDDNYYYSAVKYCYKNGIIAGTSDATFSPNSNFSRVMLVTILWRMEGCPKVYESSKFTDVPESAYYYNAVQWAASKKIVSGYGEGKFKPNNNITREQLAVMLRNYAIYKKKNTNSSYSLDNFADSKNLSDFAKSAMQWAVEKKIMSGSKQGNKTMLNPKNTATRAQAAVMIHNFCLNIK